MASEVSTGNDNDAENPRHVSHVDFTFAFDDFKFSTGDLKIVVVPDPDGCTNFFDFARNRKRRREEITNEATEGIGSSSNKDSSAVVRVKALNINSAILAAKSDFFYELFSKESKQRNVTLRIHESEEAAFMDLLKFMYSIRLSTAADSALLEAFLAAYRYEVPSCMEYCLQLLCNLPMSPNSALRYLDLPSSDSMRNAVQPLTDAAKQFLAEHYKDFSNFQEETLNLPLAGVEAVLSSDDLQVASEDVVYDFVLKWSIKHYPNLEERQNIIRTRLARLIRFPHMSCMELEKVRTCNDFDPKLALELVLDALVFKTETPYRRRSLVAEEADASSYRQFVERAYKELPVKVVRFELPRQHCVIYLDLKREECANLNPKDAIHTQAFHFGGKIFFLVAQKMDQQGSFSCFSLSLGVRAMDSESFAVDYEVALRSKLTEEYVRGCKGNCTFTGAKDVVAFRSLFDIYWTVFVADYSPYFINGILHLRAELTIKQ